MSKRGQITLFLIIGILILSTLGVIIYFVNQNTSEDIKTEEEHFLTLNKEKGTIQLYLKGCLEENLVNVVQFTSLQGGYFGVPNKYVRYELIGIDNQNIYIPYYLDSGVSSIVTQERFEEEISFGTKAYLYKCANFSIFPYNVSANLKKSEVKTKLIDNYVISDITLPITITKGEAKTEFAKFNIKIPSTVYQLFETAKEINNVQIENENEICITCFPEIMLDYGVNIETIQAENEQNEHVILYSIGDLQEQFSFTFAHKFDTDDNEIFDDLKITPIDTITINLGEEWNYLVEATGVGLKYYDDTELFEINSKTGIIKFFPSSDEVGEFVITLTVEDSLGDSKEEIFTLIVKSETEHYIQPIGYINAKVGQLLTYQVVVEGDKNRSYSFYDNSGLFDINISTGIINFVPEESHLGEHLINITVVGENDKTVTDFGYLIIDK